LVLDDDGKPRGFGFVEFEDEKSAQAALTANNTELKKRRLAVTLADTRVRPAKAKGQAAREAKMDMQNRTLRVFNLPTDASDGLLQQVIEKVVPVKRVEVLEGKEEAVLELYSAAVRSLDKRLLLQAVDLFC
jgi:squamous cell carcinoma antigen recognized by T-cells 3